jgi:predicted amidohydrolase YtcJ
VSVKTAIDRLCRAAVAMLLLAVLPAMAQSEADHVFLNGKILTVDAEYSMAEAIAIRGDRIVAVGTNAEARRFVDARTTVTDLHGATVVPGLIDNHLHFLRAVQRWHRQARLDGVASRSDALAILAEKARSFEPGEWIMVQGGWYEAQFADAPGGFSLEELDTVAPDNPLFVQLSYSVVYANSLALTAAGLSPADGARRSAAGLATFQPPYGRLIQEIPPTSPTQLDRNLDAFMLTLNRAGLTALYALGRGPEGEEAVLERRLRAGPMPLRIWETLAYEANDPAGVDTAVALLESSTPNTFDGQYGRYGIGEHVYLPFFDLPGQSGPWDPSIVDEYMKIAAAAAHGGWHIHEHTMTNYSVVDLLERFEVLNATVPIGELRWTLAHVYDISRESILRARDLGLTLAVHGVAMQSAVPVPFRDIADSGIVFGLGTDATIVSHYQPFVTLGWAVSGTDLADRHVLDQTLSREEALVAHTRSNAYLFRQEDNLGSLEPGKFADLVVLDRDYMTVPAQEIKHIEPVLTMVGGRVVYEADQ